MPKVCIATNDIEVGKGVRDLPFPPSKVAKGCLSLACGAEPISYSAGCLCQREGPPTPCISGKTVDASAGVTSSVTWGRNSKVQMDWKDHAFFSFFLIPEGGRRRLAGLNFSDLLCRMLSRRFAEGDMVLITKDSISLPLILLSTMKIGINRMSDQAWRRNNLYRGRW